MTVVVPQVTLVGERVRLEPLGLQHVDALVEAALGATQTDRHAWIPDPDPDAVAAYIQVAIEAYASGSALAFATVALGHDRKREGSSDGVSDGSDEPAEKVVGSTRFAHLDRWPWPPSLPMPAERNSGVGPDSAELGGTWLTDGVRRTSVNSEAKLLMLTHAFEIWRCERIWLQCDHRNANSRASIERIGAQFEGLTRNHRFGWDGSVRTSAVFSFVLDEWPLAKAHLVSLLGGTR